MIAFAGTGHAIFKIDPTEQDADLVIQAEEMFLKNVTDDIVDIITMASDERFQHARSAEKYFKDHASLRKPTLPPESP